MSSLLDAWDEEPTPAAATPGVVVEAELEAALSLLDAWKTGTVPPEPPKQPKVGEYRYAYDVHDLWEVDPPTPLIEGIIDVSSAAFLSGAFGTWKTFCAIAWACSLATGLPWGDHTVPTPAPVVYVAAEGASGIYLRVMAWEKAHRDELIAAGYKDGRIPRGMFTVIPRPVKVLDEEALLECWQLVIDTKAKMLVLDTFRKMTPGVDEDKSTAVSEVTSAVDAIKLDTGCSILWVHHTGHAGVRARGSSALEDDTDISWVIELQKENKRDEDGGRNLSQRKVKDGKLRPDRALLLCEVEDILIPGRPRVVDKDGNEIKPARPARTMRSAWADVVTSDLVDGGEGEGGSKKGKTGGAKVEQVRRDVVALLMSRLAGFTKNKISEQVSGGEDAIEEQLKQLRALNVLEADATGPNGALVWKIKGAGRDQAALDKITGADGTAVPAPTPRSSATPPAKPAGGAPTARMEAVMAFVDDNPGCSSQEIREGVTGNNNETAAAITALAEAGEIERRKVNGAGYSKWFVVGTPTPAAPAVVPAPAAAPAAPVTPHVVAPAPAPQTSAAANEELRVRYETIDVLARGGRPTTSIIGTLVEADIRVVRAVLQMLHAEGRVVGSDVEGWALRGAVPPPPPALPVAPPALDMTVTAPPPLNNPFAEVPPAPVDPELRARILAIVGSNPGILATPLTQMAMVGSSYAEASAAIKALEAEGAVVVTVDATQKGRPRREHRLA